MDAEPARQPRRQGPADAGRLELSARRQEHAERRGHPRRMDQHQIPDGVRQLRSRRSNLLSAASADDDRQHPAVAIVAVDRSIHRSNEDDLQQDPISFRRTVGFSSRRAGVGEGSPGPLSVGQSSLPHSILSRSPGRKGVCRCREYSGQD